MNLTLRVLCDRTSSSSWCQCRRSHQQAITEFSQVWPETFYASLGKLVTTMDMQKKHVRVGDERVYDQELMAECRVKTVALENRKEWCIIRETQLPSPHNRCFHWKCAQVPSPSCQLESSTSRIATRYGSNRIWLGVWPSGNPSSPHRTSRNTQFTFTYTTTY